jgi:hypothetical protein
MKSHENLDVRTDALRGPSMKAPGCAGGLLLHFEQNIMFAYYLAGVGMGFGHS